MRINHSIFLLVLLSYNFKCQWCRVIDKKFKLPDTSFLTDQQTTPSSPDESLLHIQNLGNVATQIPPVTKRCAIPNLQSSLDLQSDNNDPTLSLSRRDLTAKRMQQCSACKNRKLCKEKKICQHCDALCANLESTGNANENENDLVILASRFQQDETPNNFTKYYSLAGIEDGPIMNLLTKLLKISQKYDKLIILGQLSNKATNINKNIVIIDLAKAFGSDDEAEAAIYQVDKNVNVAVDDLNTKLDKALQKKIAENGDNHLTMEEIYGIVDDVIGEKETTTTSSPEQTDVINKTFDKIVTPSRFKTNEETLAENSSEVDPNKAAGEKVEDNIFDSAELSPTLESADFIQKSNENPARAIPEDLSKTIFKVIDDGIKATSNLDQNLQNVPNMPNSPILEEPPQSFFTEPVQPQQANNNNLIETVDDPLNKQPLTDIVQEVLEPIVEENDKHFNQETPPPSMNQESLPIKSAVEPKMENVANITPSTTEMKNIEKIPENPEKVLNRGKFEENLPTENNYFGALVPVKDLPNGMTDPRVKKLFYVGDNINLPLKMYQDENGVMKLKVDTDSLCNCKNETCASKHMQEKFRRSKDDETPFPELQVRFGGANNDSELPIVKRSVDNSELYLQKLEEIEKLELENEINKLDEHIEQMNEDNKSLVNQGTVALFKKVHGKNNDSSMLTLANNFLNWMRVESLKDIM